jgi:hypothetical protein
MLRLSFHECLYYYCIILLCTTFVCFSLFGFDPQLFTLRCAWFLDVGVFATYTSFADGTSRSTQNLASIAWEIYAPMNELISLHDVCLDRATKNIVEYSTVIELLTDVISLGICHLVVRLDS